MLAVQNLVTPIIKPLTSNDVTAYRALRKKILTSGDGCYFSDSYTREAQLTDKQWNDWCTETNDHCIFGTYLNDELIGVMMVTRQTAFNPLPTVEWEAVWLDHRYRRLGIARMMYEYVQQWTINQGYKRVILYIRADNLRSLNIHRKLGARYTYTKHQDVWADGSIADCHAFTLDLGLSQTSITQQHALSHLQSTLSCLTPEDSIEREDSFVAV